MPPCLKVKHLALFQLLRWHGSLRWWYLSECSAYYIAVECRMCSGMWRGARGESRWHQICPLPNFIILVPTLIRIFEDVVCCLSFVFNLASTLRFTNHHFLNLSTWESIQDKGQVSGCQKACAALRSGIFGSSPGTYIGSRSRLLGI